MLNSKKQSMSFIVSVTPFVISNTVAGIDAAAVTRRVAEAGRTGMQLITLPTQIRNEQLLKKTLHNLGAGTVTTTPNSLQSEIEATRILFQKTTEGIFHITLAGVITQQEAESFTAELQQEYGNVLQDYVYLQLKEKAAAKGLTLTQEAVQKDQSIVLTYNLNQ